MHMSVRELTCCSVRARIDQIVDVNYGVGFKVWEGVQRASLTASWKILRGMIKTFFKKKHSKRRTRSAGAAETKPEAGVMQVVDLAKTEATAPVEVVPEDADKDEDEAHFIKRLHTVTISLLGGKL